MALTGAVYHSVPPTGGESTPALSAQCEFRQSDETLRRDSKEWRETRASKQQDERRVHCTAQRGQNKWT